MKTLDEYLNRSDIPKDVKRWLKIKFKERLDAEDSLRKHAQMLDFANDTIMIRNLKDHIIYWNQGAERLYGWEKDEALGQYVHTFLKTAFPIPLKKIKSILYRDNYWSGELIHRKRNGTKIFVGSRWTLQRDSRGKPIAYLEINNDITNLKRTEKDLQKAHQLLEKKVQERTIELKEANLELLRQIKERKRLEKEILAISSQQQRKIGQDLHDGLSQHLTGISFLSKVLEKKLNKKAPDEALEVGKINDLVNDAIAQTRSLARGLHPVSLESEGFVSALQELCSETENLFKVPCLFSCKQKIIIQNNATATHLYLIAQEALNNAIKHGRIKHIWIDLSKNRGKITMNVKDDGIGIHSQRKKTSGMGLRIMKYRSEMINGHLLIRKNQEGGTTVTCTFEVKA